MNEEEEKVEEDREKYLEKLDETLLKMIKECKEDRRIRVILYTSPDLRENLLNTLKLDKNISVKHVLKIVPIISVEVPISYLTELAKNKNILKIRYPKKYRITGNVK